MYKLRALLIAFFLLFLIPTPKLDNSPVVASKTTLVESKTLDPRAEILQAYLAKYNSPLQFHAQDFIDAADKYKLDWKLVPAIAGVESTFGKQIPGGFNGWGWGVYGDQALGFSSWTDGIYTVSEGLRTGYFDKGLTDPYAINRKYAASNSWGKHVSYFLADINKFEQKYIAQNNIKQLAYLNIGNNISGSSAQLSSQLR